MDRISHNASMNARVSEILSGLALGKDNIYSYDFENSCQSDEVRLRRKAAYRSYDDYLSEISKHHSVCVMDREASLFLRNTPHTV
ncbi:MAG: hypothetical protein JRF06_00025 [Deltaproteobacteria bacterium]|nr:hypothetical protein [Deltaproteobacteria bacterium]